jgi:MFS transporter, DHA1 family, multidrug resistance protein
MLGQGLVSPVLPLFAETFNVGLAAVGATMSAFALARMVLNTPLGLVSDRFGRKPLLVVGPIVVAIGMAGSGLSPTIATLIAWRFVAGVGSAMYMTGAMAFLADIATPDRRARFLGTNQAALQLGVSIGPAIGGLIAEQFGLRAPFWVVTALALLAALYSAIRLPESLVPGDPSVWTKGRNRGAIKVLFRSRAYTSILLVVMVIFLTRGTARASLLPLQGAIEFGLGAGEIGLILSGMEAVNLLALPLTASLADRFNRRWLILPALISMTVALVAFAVSDTLTFFIVAAGMQAVATSMAGPAPAAFAADAAPAEARGLAFGIYRTAGDLGLFIGPPVLGAVADVAGFGAAFGVNAVLVAVVAVVFWIWGRPAADAKALTVG